MGKLHLVLPVFLGLALPVVGFPTLTSAQSSGRADGLRLRIEVTGFRNADGRAAVGVFDSKEGFLKVAHRVTGSLAGISNGRAVIDFSGLRPGKYAIAVLHDENANNKLDTSLIGIPREGYGFTNDALGIIGPPSFEKAAFVLEHDSRVQIHMHYGL